MPLETLPNEILTHIFTTLPTLDAVLALAATSTHFYRLYHDSQRLAILAAVLDKEFGPLDAILQICTHNASQPAHQHRQVAFSDALVEQILSIGRTAKHWEEVYPFKRWKTNYAARRLLADAERYTLRRAIYRLWLFTRAFHNPNHSRNTRNNPAILTDRAALLHNWSTPDLAEMLDTHNILRDVVANNICPSNGKMRQKFSKRYPDSSLQQHNSHQPMFNIYGNHPPPPSASWCATGEAAWMNSSIITSAKYTHTRLQPSRWHDPGMEGWGDDINHYYVVEDMLKLDPQQLLFLRDRCPLKVQVEGFIKTRVEGGEGGWFANNGETFCETLWAVLKQRGGGCVQRGGGGWGDGGGCCVRGGA